MLCRVLEHILADKLLTHFMSNNLLDPFQFGFLPGRTSCTQFISAISSWLECYEVDNSSIDIVYADISNAFDSVSHGKLVSVLLFSTGVGIR